MKYFCIFLLAIVFHRVNSKIKHSVLVNKINSDVMKPVGKPAKFEPILPEPTHAPEVARRHLDIAQICNKKEEGRLIKDTPNVVIVGDYYDEMSEKTMITIRMPHHIDKHHFQVTTSDPYFTVGPIEPIGYNPPERHVDSCERAYQEHMGDQYSAESADVSQESLEMIRVPVHKVDHSKLAPLLGDYK